VLNNLRGSIEMTEEAGTEDNRGGDLPATSDDGSHFFEFQKLEYEKIADAHFKALEAISFFFRYYLLVMSVPLSILAVLFGIAGRGSDFEKAAVSLLGLASIFFIVVGVVGFCMMMYIINMKMDVVLYSRVVNSIRKFFYDEHDADHTNKLLMRQLPQSAFFPSYRDMPFGFVILAFALFDVLYLGLGAHLLIATQFKGAAVVHDLNPGIYSRTETIVFAAIIGLGLVAHFIAYQLFATYREFSYLRASAIGIDIDGVLNKHREKFCELAGSKLGKHIRPDEIKVLPVSDNVGLSHPMTRADERQIFNDPEYWLEMPALEGAAEAIKSIKRSLLLPVHIFTYRPWPDLSASGGADRAQLRAAREAWRNAADEMARRANAKECVRLWVNIRTFFNDRMSITYITKYWLRQNDILFDSLLVEKGNENIVYARGRYENRFNYAKRKKIRFFVEDDWVKAIKLSYICDVVFLIDHPYNRTAEEDVSKHADSSIIGKLPPNILRVESWNKLKKMITQLV
jgi:hypothetical protein